MPAKPRKPELQERLRALPSVEELLQTEPLRSAAQQAARPLAVAAARVELERARAEIRAGNGAADTLRLAADAAKELERRAAPSLERVVNATGVVVHTNLGRAPLAEDALRAIERVGHGYSNLEYDLEQGTRGSRHVHVRKLICELTEGEDGFAVNNNAAAVLLALAALASGREVVVSRGQLVEIGGSFRIPEILKSSGARLVEVGTTNRTRLSDYEQAIGDGTVALMRVHCSNFRTVGFTEEVAVDQLCELARRRGLLVIDDLGSGVIAHQSGNALEAGTAEARLAEVLEDEPSACRSISAGADVVCFSTDKLLGGPQGGVIAGRSEPIERMRSHPLARAVRIDKLSLLTLEASLRLHRDPARAVAELPVLRMLSVSEEELVARAALLRDAIAAKARGLAAIGLERATGRAGGGALPLLELEGPVVAVRPSAGGPDDLQAHLRAHRPPIIARVHEGALLLDPRTIRDDEVDVTAAGVAAALR